MEREKYPTYYFHIRSDVEERVVQRACTYERSSSRRKKGEKKGRRIGDISTEEKHDRLLSKRKSWGQFRGRGGGIT